jgi:hypothetical protein
MVEEVEVLGVVESMIEGEGICVSLMFISLVGAHVDKVMLLR